MVVEAIYKTDDILLFIIKNNEWSSKTISETTILYHQSEGIILMINLQFLVFFEVKNIRQKITAEHYWTWKYYFNYVLLYKSVHN